MGQPEWLKDAVFYEIYPQSFFDSNNDGIGDVNGITEKLDYICELGCNAIWINPLFQSPFGDAGYDVEDYCRVAPRYGTNEDLIRMFKEAHRRGMHVLLDLVPGHTAITHEWFKKSMLAEKNEYTDRYVWTDCVWKQPEGMECIRGISERDGACVINFFSHQPALNYGFYNRDPECKWQQSVDDPGPAATREAMKDVMKFWLDAGCDGFRIDMAGSLVKNDPEGKGTIALWNRVFADIKKAYPQAAMVSEWGEPDKSLNAGFDMDFLLHFGPSHYNDLFRCDEPYFSKEGKGSAEEFVNKYLENLAKSNGKGLICIPSGNHDMDRLARRLDEREIKVAFTFLLSMPGAPFIYYGDEIGMKYVEGLISKEGGYSRTGSRTPMQWDDGKNAGFSEAAEDMLYLPVDPDKNRPTAEAQKDDADSIYSTVKELIKVRRNNPALLNNGKIEFVSVGYPLCYKRICDEQQVLVVINPKDEACSLNDVRGKIIYKLGDCSLGDNGGLRLAGQSSVFVEVE